MKKIIEKIKAIVNVLFTAKLWNPLFVIQVLVTPITNAVGLGIAGAVVGFLAGLAGGFRSSGDMLDHAIDTIYGRKGE